MAAIALHLIEAAAFTADEERAMIARLGAADRGRLPSEPAARRGFLAVRAARPQLGLGLGLGRGDAGGDRRVAIARAGASALIAVAGPAEVAHLGVDLEDRARAADPAAWERVAFDDADRRSLAAAVDRAAAAIQLWCRKEAVVKALGTGFAIEPRDVPVLAPRVVLRGVTLALFDLALPAAADGGARFGAIAATPGARPGPIARWIVGGDGELRPAAPPR